MVQCLSYIRDQKFVTSLVHSAITCTEEWNAVQYLVNKTNNYGLIPESKSFRYYENSPIHSNSPFLIHFTN